MVKTHPATPQWTRVRREHWQKDAKPKWQQGSVTDAEAISRKLCGILRHGAEKMGLTVRKDGYVKVSDVLELEFFASRAVQEEDVRYIVDTNEKKRFGLLIPPGETELHIRAHQGHSMESVADSALLHTIQSADELDVLSHGTFAHLWPSILEEGLKTMGRNHIHCVNVDLANPQHQGVVMSGTRGESDVVVYVNFRAAMEEGISFQWSENNVVLTKGHNNVLPPHLFSGVNWWDYEQEAWCYEELNL